ncbi:hypothetical protein PYW07_012545 [Mythimna separata]|uniref:C2H2-type domain-containing protein n=1 Tax=Mythimna separata TaxID=271217 RepID=A0AAD7Y8E0_MYTSE|nr:hypothetical protein PYW07_012545 [Mythimna separata]
MEHVAIKEELPVYYEGPEDIIEPKEEPHSDDANLEIKDDNGYLDVEETPLQHSETDLDITEFKTEVEEEQEELRKQHKASDTTRAGAAKKPKEDTQKTKLEDDQRKNKISETKIIQTTQRLVGKNLQDLYESLTHIPFIIEDSRPMLACFFCYAKLKQCCQLQRQCLQAEKLFAEMMNEPNPSINRVQSKLFNAFVKTEVVNISIDGVVQMEHVAIKEEVPVYYDGLEDIIEPKEEPLSDDCENTNNGYSDIEDTPMQHLESDMTMEIKVEMVEAQDSESKCSATDAPSLNIMEFKVEVEEEQEILRKTLEATDTIRTSTVKKLKEDTRRIKVEDGIPEKQMKIELSQTKIIQNSQNQTHKKTFKQPHKCNECQRIYSTNSSLQRHLRTHTGEKPYKCAICQRSFSRKGDVDRHSLTHTGEKPYKCDMCQRSFNRKSHLLQHIRTHTGEERYECDICHSRFSSRDDFRYHLRTHTEKKPYKCELCHRGCSSKSYLALHMRSHTGEEPYKCDVCQRGFSNHNALTLHMRTHSGEKPFKCDVCQRGFGRKSDLDRHSLTHTGEKPYTCEICQRSFNQKSNLLQHVRTHTGEELFNCNFCQCSFTQKNNLLKHIRIHTDEEP